MSTQDEDRQGQGVVWAVLIGAVLLAISLAVGVGLSRVGGAAGAHSAHAGHTGHTGAHTQGDMHSGHAQGEHAQGSAAPAQPAPATDSADAAEAAATGVAAAADGASIRVEEGVVKFYFASGSAELAPGAAEALAEVLKGVATGKTAVISGFHDTTGNRAFNEELSKQRALAVRDVLMMLGVAEDKLSLQKPAAEEMAAGNNAEARRVEVRLE